MATPFAIAGVLTVLVFNLDRLHLYRERIIGYGFLFAAPWAWLLDLLWIPNVHSGCKGELLGCVILLWIPAALYSVCVWLLFVAVRMASRRRDG
jgi:hypothetical protein